MSQYFKQFLLGRRTMKHNLFFLFTTFSALAGFKIHHQNLIQSLTQAEGIQEQQRRQSYFRHGFKMIPHIEKKYKGGEDACYADDQLLVVLDGVGGWNEVGVDPGLFTKQFIKLIEQEHKNDPNLELKILLEKALVQVTNQGSSTAVLLKIDPQRPDVLNTANLGDSGYAIFRVVDQQLELYYRSKEQQHGYDFPFQCGTNGDPTSDAETQEHTLKDNDILVVGSDGLFDNLYNNDIQSCIQTQIIGQNYEVDPTAVAECIAAKAEQVSFSETHFSPFAKHAKEAGKEYQGGKMDDITVVVGQFKNRQNDIV
ncbi:serine threonine family 2c [Stylonychia lemnae]|uniref:Protein phosphatase n=1 Tax=Stylonychia lemnae TaxID=5949 RepID=A0A078BAC5_STYLE|nr:serine threonine family 2c [Stylonychia lemnae]|eukprot:CDW91186.1 serine threonine family 2c [Stylonychia lemnae]